MAAVMSTWGVDQFPPELADRPQWLCWRYVQKDGQKKPSKMPYYAAGGLRRGVQGSDEDRAQLVTYGAALDAAQRQGMDGVGFAFLPGDGLIGIDLDGCTGNPEREARAQRIIDACASYTERSPSGNGYHIIVFGQTETFKSNEIGVEVFCGSQFFTMTGQWVGEPVGVQQISDKTLETLRKTVRKASPPPAAPTAPADIPHSAKVESALAMISPDCGYEDWIRVGMAIHAALGDGALGVWDRWSSRGAKYKGGKDIESHWKSFRAGGVGEGTLFKMAMDAGWMPPRPPGQPRPQRPAAPALPAAVDPDTGEILDAPPPANDNAPAMRGHDLAAVDWYSPFPDTNGKGKPIGTIENVREAARRLGVTIRYNVIRKDLEILIPGTGFSIDNNANASLAWFTSACIRFGVPTSELQGYLTFLADQNLYNPVAQWISSRPWDGRSRLQALCNTIKAEGEEDDLSIAELKEALIRRWMISAVAAAFNQNGVSAHGVLVLQGDQYLGKTKWFKGLVPPELGVIQDGLTLKPDDKDSVKNVVRNWLVELGELDATFRKSDIAMLKSFLTKDRDVLRKPFDRRESEFARRTVFFASVNPRQFLHDPTGNRRYWTISCASIDHDHGLDMQQVWAEVHAEHYAKGESWYLTPDEMAALNGQNREHEVLDPIRERIMSRLDWEAPTPQWRWMTATDVMSECGFDRPTRADVTQAGLILQELNGKKRKTVRGRALAMVPPRLPTSGI